MRLQWLGTVMSGADGDEEDGQLFFKVNDDDCETYFPATEEQLQEWAKHNGKAIAITIEVLDIPGKKVDDDE
jgi:hypothetical protein